MAGDSDFVRSAIESAFEQAVTDLFKEYLIWKSEQDSPAWREIAGNETPEDRFSLGFHRALDARALALKMFCPT